MPPLTKKQKITNIFKIHFLATVSNEPSCSKTRSNAELSNQWRMKHSREDVNDPTTALSNINKRFKNSQGITSDFKGKR